MAIFSVAKNLSLWIITCSCGMVIFITIVFEMLTHRLQHYCQSEASDLNANLFQELLSKLHSELMILGK
jgi:hypothetical protein